MYNSEHYTEPEVEIRHEDGIGSAQERNELDSENHATFPITAISNYSNEISVSNTTGNLYSTNQNGIIPTTETSRLLTSGQGNNT